MNTNQLPREKTTFVMITVLSLSMVFGGLSFAQNAANPVRELSIDKSIELALANNSQLKLAQLGVEKTEISYKKAKVMARDENISGPKGTIAEGLQKRFDPRNAEGQYNIAKKTLEVTEKNTKLLVKQAYYEVLKKAKLLEVKQLSLQRANEQLRLAQANFKAGRFAKVEVTAAETLATRAQAEISTYETQYKVAVMKFNKIIGLDVETPLKLTEKLTYVPMDKIDLEKSTADALANSVETYAEREKKAINDALFEVQKSYYTSNVYSFQEQQVENKKAELRVKDVEIDMRIAVKQAYLNLRSAEDQIKMLSKSMEKQKEAVRITTLKYKVGLATNADLLDGNVALDEIAEQYASAVFNYNVAKTQFENGLFTISP